MQLRYGKTFKKNLFHLALTAKNIMKSTGDLIMTNNLITLTFDEPLFQDKPNLVSKLKRIASVVHHGDLMLLDGDDFIVPLWDEEKEEEFDLLKAGECGFHKTEETTCSLEPVEEQDFYVRGFKSGELSFPINDTVETVYCQTTVDKIGNCSLVLRDSDNDVTLFTHNGQLETYYSFEPSFGLYPEEQLISLTAINVVAQDKPIAEIKLMCKEFYENLAKINNHEKLIEAMKSVDEASNFPETVRATADLVAVGAAIMEQGA